MSPRFAVACSEKLMRGAADLAQRHNSYIQTHLAENLEEMEKVGQDGENEKTRAIAAGTMAD